MPKILCVDDDPLVRELIVQSLQDEGLSTVDAENGRTALARLDDGDVELVITDMIMPEMDGIEFLSAARERQPDTPIIALSGGYTVLPKHAETTKSILKLASQLGVFAVLAKPIEPEELVAKVHEALAQTDVRKAS